MSRRDSKKETSRRGIGLALVVVGIVLAGVVTLGLLPDGDSATTTRFDDVARQTREFLAFNKSIELNPDQEAIMRQALTELPAPCCSDKTAYTCCCECNMAKTWWGLSKHLIVDEGYDAVEVRAAVEDWFAFINPAGFSGDACYTGGCFRPFRQNGCGGMDESQIAL